MIENVRIIFICSDSLFRVLIQVERSTTEERQGVKLFVRELGYG